EPRGQVLALEPLHGQVELVVDAAVREVGDDAWVAQRGEELGLAREARLGVGAGDADGLDRGQPAGLAVERAVDDAHAAAGGGALELEAAVEKVAGLHQPIVVRLSVAAWLGMSSRKPRRRRGSAMVSARARSRAFAVASAAAAPSRSPAAAS